MDVLERFKQITESARAEDMALKEACSELKEHVEQVEYHFKRIQGCFDEILNNLDIEIESEDLLFSEEVELPIEDYKLIREKFGEEAANRMYYDVKLKKVPLRFVQRALNNFINEKEW